MIEKVGRRIRIPLSRVPADLPAGPSSAEPDDPPRIDFVAYGEDCLLVGQIALGATRLSDLMNDHDEYELVDVEVHSLTGDPAARAQEVVVPREELLLVHAAGPRGDRAARVRTRQHPIAIAAGPYQVRGYYHALPGADAISSFRHRRPMVPLTDVWVEYRLGGVPQRRRVATLLVNRQQIDWVVEAEDEQIELPDLPLAREDGPLVKDFTGLVFARD